MGKCRADVGEAKKNVFFRFHSKLLTFNGFSISGYRLRFAFPNVSIYNSLTFKAHGFRSSNRGRLPKQPYKNTTFGKLRLRWFYAGK